jgi:hypothetical protein
MVGVGWYEPGNSYCRGRISTVDRLELISLYELILILKIIFTFVTIQATFMRRSTEQSVPCLTTLTVRIKVL